MSNSARSISSYTATRTTAIGSGVGTVEEGGSGANMAPNVPAYIPFALTTRQANAEVSINYNSTNGIKLLNSAILKIA